MDSEIVTYEKSDLDPVENRLLGRCVHHASTYRS